MSAHRTQGNVAVIGSHQLGESNREEIASTTAAWTEKVEYLSCEY